ncbi:hypothetical protein JOD43_003437 [Pullulanibacillus pueri]|uniref:Uncharacterized protein n=1 Tax=Pullulanibacillus pueri TaxID=1437324 RepID=A0A8J2ZYA8_9BACL|nr:hypothetical protein [Pullulanibacillus pueri]MBM7683258.1 hypothetical protein [Pullulanibacillus pueri]GGH85756.1 hypothetical protein GCM10007096_31880 [Pullulanibacillus pueri]
MHISHKHSERLLPIFEEQEARELLSPSFETPGTNPLLFSGGQEAVRELKKGFKR